MTRKLSLLSFAFLLLATTLFASTIDIVIPAGGTGPGAGGSRWQSEVSIHNAAPVDITFTMTLHNTNGASTSVTETVGSNKTIAIADIFKTKFGVDAGTGGVSFDLADDSLIRRIAVTSRTFNQSGGGEFGQDIPAIVASEAFHAGSTAILMAPSDVANFRFNFGIFALSETRVVWKLFRANGDLAADVSRTYAAGVQAQYNGGVQSLLGVQAENNDVIRAIIESGTALIYGSAVDGRTGDPTYIPSVRNRLNTSLEFLGVDMNEDDLVDQEDLDYDGRLDVALDIYASFYPSFFRLIANDPQGRVITYSIVNPTVEIKLIDDKGTVQWYPGFEQKGTSTELRVRATAGTDSAEFVIPAFIH